MLHMQIIIIVITYQCEYDAQDCIYNTKSNKQTKKWLTKIINNIQTLQFQRN